MFTSPGEGKPHIRSLQNLIVSIARRHFPFKTRGTARTSRDTACHISAGLSRSNCPHSSPRQQHQQYLCLRLTRHIYCTIDVRPFDQQGQTVKFTDINSDKFYSAGRRNFNILHQGCLAGFGGFGSAAGETQASGNDRGKGVTADRDHSCSGARRGPTGLRTPARW